MMPMTENRNLDVRLKPNSSTNELKICGNSLEIRIAASPIENAANKRLLEYLSELTKIAKSKFHISAGVHSRNKKISCDGYCADEILEILRKRNVVIFM
jgi:uncharacterized protein YggU (UPF0235/DUF167 family)